MPDVIAAVSRVAWAFFPGVQRESVHLHEEVYRGVHLAAPRHGQDILRQVRPDVSRPFLWRTSKLVIPDLPVQYHRQAPLGPTCRIFSPGASACPGSAQLACVLVKQLMA